MKQITPHLYQISLGAVNAFLIDDDGLTLIDAGYPGYVDKIFDAIQKGGKDPSQIKNILITHAHPDHVGSLAAIAQRQSVEIIAHPEDAEMIEKGYALRKHLKPAPALFYKIMTGLFLNVDKGEVEACQVNQRVNDGDILPIAGGIEVIHTPGHSAGHIAFLFKKDRVLIAGDICGNVMGLGYSIVYEDYDLGMRSILKAASYDFDTAVFGHGKALMTQANNKLKAKFEKKVKS